MSEAEKPIDPFELCASCHHSARAHQGSYQGPGTVGCAAWKICVECHNCGYICPCNKFEREPFVFHQVAGA